MEKNIGLFGGTFNPPHIGHLMIAQEALKQLNLDEVWWMPASNPPHKKKVEDVSDNHRIEMVKKTIGNNNQFSLSLLEFERSGPSYTIDTVRSLNEKFPSVKFTFIIGGDMVHSLDSWHQIDQLKELVQFAGVGREGFPVDDHWERFHVKLVEVPTIGISSTFIRSKAKEKSNIRYFVTDDVWKYIEEHRIYG
ncbi:nicotinate-nucleotide adenylyltransferase [Fictibacillus phosphorivorans]|uniref:nicotinate-nucleotide adenylyltransferase n=1 Tax=Fictibacillus phosphorivorans TaxID=1221500 RepID=UPI0020419E24|nr:nicotinate-nucleotide adenylyltransferase [Fictibacillus phosphorivorans]MCM3716902.1 nicotinate-nucleotide adenylyltransferase [Fictibacillus phosphorivorans]MCM3774549.1 nicotinate-nucleotide adenylyltransferase [Fictibacillus phosphorivorans]